MKKYLVLIISLLLFLPIGVKADAGIDNFYMEATILENGDIKVREAFILNGSYNGFERIIEYKNSGTPEFDPNKDYYGGSALHNGSGITLDKVGAIDIYSDYDYNLLNKEVDYFKYNSNASKGDYGYYDYSNNYDGITIAIFNPSKKKKAFYLEYTIHDMAIRHNDIGEIGWNLFDSLSESIGHFELYIKVPNNKNEIRVWAHGPLHGLSEIIDKNTVKVTIDNLAAYNAIDVRLAFDLDVIPNATKKSNVNALEKIVYYEENQAEIANEERAEAQKELLREATRLVELAEQNPNRDNYNRAQNYLDWYIDGGEERNLLENRLNAVLEKIEAREATIRTILYCVLGVWTLGLVFILFRVYNKYDKEYKADFDGQYFRDFPKDYGPEIVEYLFDKKIDTKGLSAAILNLIANKVLSVETQGKIHTLTYNYNPDLKLSTSDQKLIQWLIFKVGDGTKVTLDEFQKAGKKYESFLKNYRDWINSATEEAISYNFYEKSTETIILTCLYALLAIPIGIGLVKYQASFIWMIILPLVSIICIGYLVTVRKRTVNGNNDYARWKGLKNFIKDFGQFADRDLPDVHLWEKYLVYALVFGLAKQLSETMKIKIKNMNYDGVEVGDFTDTIIRVNMLSDFNKIIDHSVAQALSTANSAYAAAHSSSSSGYGGGGGFSGGSSGGGSFGGGGGGGRF